MKLKIALLAACAAAGVFASMAVANPPTGKGNPHDQASTSTSTTTTGHGKKKGKVLVCHKLPNGHYVLVNVNGNSSLAKLKHLSDVLAGTGGTCPGPIQGHTGTGTGENETTTVNTTTSTSTSTSTKTETETDTDTETETETDSGD